MSGFLKRCNFKHTELLFHLKSFNDECAVKEANDANLLRQESKLTRVKLQLNLCPSKSTTHVLKRILFQYIYQNMFNLSSSQDQVSNLIVYNAYSS